MMKRIFCALLSLLCLVAFASCSDSDVPEGMLKAGNDAVDYYFFYPDSWEIDRNDGEIVIKPAVADGSVTQISLSVTAFSLESGKSNYGVRDVWKEYREELVKTFPDFTLKNAAEEETSASENSTAFATPESSENGENSETTVTSETSAVISTVPSPSEAETSLAMLEDAPSLRVEYTFTIGSTVYRYANVLCVRNGYIYMILYSAPEAVFDTEISAMDTVVSNFHFQ